MTNPVEDDPTTIDVESWEIYEPSKELVTVKLPRTKTQRERDAWTKTMDGKTVAEQWVLELMRHGRQDRIEEFIAQVEAGNEELPPPTRSFVQWRSRKWLDPDLADRLHRALAFPPDSNWVDTDALARHFGTTAPTRQQQRDEAQVETSQYPHLEKLFRP